MLIHVDVSGDTITIRSDGEDCDVYKGKYSAQDGLMPHLKRFFKDRCIYETNMICVELEEDKYIFFSHRRTYPDAFSAFIWETDLILKSAVDENWGLYVLERGASVILVAHCLRCMYSKWIRNFDRSILKISAEEFLSECMRAYNNGSPLGVPDGAKIHSLDLV